MSVEEDKVPFLSRWSRRKLEAKEAPPEQEALPVVSAPANVPATEVPELPPLASLDGLKSEYRDFLHPQVDEKLRRGALKKLFGDPHFNTMDMLDTYVDDYSIADPIPEAMLKQMVQSRTLALFEKDEESSQLETPAATDLTAEVPVQPALPAPLAQTNNPDGSAGNAIAPPEIIPDTKK